VCTFVSGDILSGGVIVVVKMVVIKPSDCTTIMQHHSFEILQDSKLPSFKINNTVQYKSRLLNYNLVSYCMTIYFANFECSEPCTKIRLPVPFK